MCLSSLWTQPPYNDRNSLLFPPKKLNSLNYQAILILEWITSALFQLQYHDWGEILEQGTEPPTAPRGPQQYGCPLLWMCVHHVCVCSLLCVCSLGWVKCRAQILSMGHHTWPHITSLSLNSFMPGCANYFYSRLFSEWGTIQGRFY